MWEAGRNWLRWFLIEAPHPAIFILLLAPLASGTGVYPENRGGKWEARCGRLVGTGYAGS